MAVANPRALVSQFCARQRARHLREPFSPFGLRRLSGADRLDETTASKSESRFKVSMTDLFAAIIYCQICAEVTSNRMSFGRLRGPTLAAMLAEHPQSGRKGLTEEKSMRSFDWKVGLPLALTLATSAAVPQQAFAQFFFRPFAYSFNHQITDEGPPAFASRPAVASILGRVGFRLVGPLGRRGDQIVATGVNPRDGEMRFIVDPYEGRILRAIRLGPPAMYDGPRDGGDYGSGGEDSYGPPSGGPPYPPGGGVPRVGPGPVGRGPDGPASGNGDFENEPYPDGDGDRLGPDGGASLRDNGAGPQSQQSARTARKSALSPNSAAAAQPAPAPQSAKPSASAGPSASAPEKRAAAVHAARALSPGAIAPSGASSTTVVAPDASGPAASIPTDSARAKTPEAAPAKPAGG